MREHLDDISFEVYSPPRSAFSDDRPAGPLGIEGSAPATAVDDSAGTNTSTGNEFRRGLQRAGRRQRRDRAYVRCSESECQYDLRDREVGGVLPGEWGYPLPIDSPA